MAGLLDAKPQEAQAPEAAQEPNIDDPILKKIETDIEAQVPPDMKQAYLACVVAGMRVMYDEGTAHLIDEQLSQSDDVVKNVSEGIAKLVSILYSESKQQLPIPALALASITLMAQALDYGEQKFGFEITPELVAECTKATVIAVLGAFGIDPTKPAEGAQAPAAPMPGA
jgi:hypothetical protein